MVLRYGSISHASDHAAKTFTVNPRGRAPALRTLGAGAAFDRTGLRKFASSGPHGGRSHLALVVWMGSRTGAAVGRAVLRAKSIPPPLAIRRVQLRPPNPVHHHTLASCSPPVPPHVHVHLPPELPLEHPQQDYVRVDVGCCMRPLSYVFTAAWRKWRYRAGKPRFRQQPAKAFAAVAARGGAPPPPTPHQTTFTITLYIPASEVSMAELYACV